MFLVLRADARAESCVMRLGVECFKQLLRAEKRLLLHSGLRSAYPR